MWHALAFPIRPFYALHFVSLTLKLKLICLYKSDAWPDAVLFTCVTTENTTAPNSDFPDGFKEGIALGFKA